MQAAAGNLLRLARVQRGWSRQQLAVAAGVPASTVGRIESGQRQPSMLTLYRLLAAADFDLRVRLEPYDDHDDVLDALDAARTPEQRRQAQDRHERNVHAARTAVPLIRPEPVGPDRPAATGLSRLRSE